MVKKYPITKRYRKRRGKMALSRPRNPSRTGYLKTAQIFSSQIAVPAGPSPELGVAFTFKLSDLPQNVTFSKLFDSYRINKILIKAMPLTNSSVTINPNYKVLSAIDLDDAATPTTLSIMERSNVRINLISSGGKTNQILKWSIRPRYLTQLFETTVSTGYGQGSRSQWLDCADPTIPHFGLKVVFDTDPLLNAAVVWQFYITYMIEFKSLR